MATLVVETPCQAPCQAIGTGANRTGAQGLSIESLGLAIEVGYWQDTSYHAHEIERRFRMRVNGDYELDNHRRHIEHNGYGFGERAFHWLWKMIVDEMPATFKFLEIGVYKGQVLSLVKFLARRTGRVVDVTGITLLSTFTGVTGKFTELPDVDYKERIEAIHELYSLEQPRLLVGDSTAPGIHEAARALAPFDVVYVDGCHEYDYVVKDLLFYPTLVRPGGLLVVDDASCNLDQPDYFFKGIESVSRAVRTVIETDPQWEHLFAVIHNRVWRKT